MSLGQILIGLAGPAGCGKTTAAALLVHRHRFHRISFADPLREAVGALLPGGGAWHVTAGKDLPALWSEGATAPLTPRDLMRAIGDHVNHVSQGAYIAFAARRADQLMARGGSVVIDDVRMPAEAAWLRERGGWVVHVQRPGSVYRRDHATEVGPGHEAPDLTLVNPAGLAELQSEVGHLLDALRVRAS